MTPRKQIPTIEQRDDPNCECGKPLGDKGWCPECCEFRCATCGFVVHASFGAADDFPDECDECWSAYNPDVEVEHPTQEST